MTGLPNIVLIVLDTCSAKHMSLYGYERKTTPNLERIAEECAVFERCFAPAIWTTPSHASLFTGLYPSQHGVDGAAWHKYSLTDGLDTLPSILKRRGYVNFGISNNYLISSRFGFNRGFDTFYEMDVPRIFENELQIPALENNIERLFYLFKKLPQRKYAKQSVYRLANALYRKCKDLRGVSVSRKSSTFTIKTTELIKKLLHDTQPSKSPFFLFVNYMENHDKYNPPPHLRHKFGSYPLDFIKRQPYAREFYEDRVSSEELGYLVDLYDEEMLFIDEVVGDVYSFAKSYDFFDNTLFVITSDHGEAFGEHGHFGHNTSVYNETTHVPFLVKFPKDVYRSGSKSTSLVQPHDFFATVLDLTGSSYLTPESSYSLLSKQRRFAISQNILSTFQQTLKSEVSGISQFVMINSDIQKLIYSTNGRQEFFDLKENWLETQNDDRVPKESLFEAICLVARLFDFDKYVRPLQPQEIS